MKPGRLADQIERSFLWFPRRKRRRSRAAPPTEPMPVLRFRHPKRVRAEPGDRFPAGGGYRILRRPQLLDNE